NLDQHALGQGRVYRGQRAVQVFKSLQLAPDFEYTSSEPDTHIEFVHRALAQGDIYFLDNRGEHGASVEATFRVRAMIPELWHAETGARIATSYRSHNGRTTVPLRLEPWGTVFVVFRKAAANPELILPTLHESRLASIEGAWTVNFQ